MYDSSSNCVLNRLGYCLFHGSWACREMHSWGGTKSSVETLPTTPERLASLSPEDLKLQLRSMKPRCRLKKSERWQIDNRIFWS